MSQCDSVFSVVKNLFGSACFILMWLHSNIKNVSNLDVQLLLERDYDRSLFLSRSVVFLLPSL
jgi:hypothetical protein